MEIASEGHTAGVTKDDIWQTPPAYNPLKAQTQVSRPTDKTLQENQFGTNMAPAIESDAGAFQESTAGLALTEIEIEVLSAAA